MRAQLLENPRVLGVLVEGDLSYCNVPSHGLSQQLYGFSQCPSLRPTEKDAFVHVPLVLRIINEVLNQVRARFARIIDLNPSYAGSCSVVGYQYLMSGVPGVKKCRVHGKGF